MLVGRAPSPAADALVGLFLGSGRAGPGVRRGRGRPPHPDYNSFAVTNTGWISTGIASSPFSAFCMFGRINPN
jgi:hypothetical protein